MRAAQMPDRLMTRGARHECCRPTSVHAVLFYRIRSERDVLRPAIGLDSTGEYCGGGTEYSAPACLERGGRRFYRLSSLDADATDVGAFVMDRRGFFRHGLERATQAGVRYADGWVNQNAGQWIRPPFALEELEFLLACTRCDACVNACPHDVIFPLAGHLGSQVAGTPALDLLHKGCHLCEDWPCVVSCQAGALAVGSGIDTEPPVGDASSSGPLPRSLAMIGIDQSRCLPYQGPECGACADSCPVSGALAWVSAKPRIDPQFCLGCSLCREACITDPPAITVTSINDNPVSGLGVPTD